MFEGAPGDDLKRVAKAGVLAAGLFVASPLEKTAEAQITTYIPSAESIQQGKKAEYVVPRKVMDAFANIADSTNAFQVGGGYMETNFLYGDRELRFKTALLGLGYSNEDISKFAEIFKGQNIIFPEDVASSAEFKEVQAHEWMHKLIHDLPQAEKAKLNAARDFIIKDYKDKEESADAETIEAYKSASTQAEREGILQKKKEILESSNPILLGSDPGHLFSIMRNPEEFFPYMLNGGLSPKVETALRDASPEADKIYESLKARIAEITK